MHSKNSFTNLKNRYTAVLKKCHLINTFGSLALIGFLCLSVNTAQAANGGKGPDADLSNQTFTYDSTSNNFNTLISSGSDATGDGNGGEGGTITANSNKTTTSGTVTGDNVYGSALFNTGGDSPNGTGGNGGTATANNNTVHVNGTVTDFIYGALTRSDGGASVSGTGGNGGNATANNNAVHVNARAELNVNGGNAESDGGLSDSGIGGNGGNATANNNIVNVNGIVEGNVNGGNAGSTGGYSAKNNGGNGGLAIANNNTVNVNGSVEGNVFGGYAQSKGGYSPSGTIGNGGLAIANNNIVNISGIVKGYIYGGYAQSISSSGGTIDTATANNNTVHLNNATVDSTNIYGGYADGNSSSKAENNTVILSNAVNFKSSTSTLYGGLAEDGAAYFPKNSFNGNALIVNNYKGSSVSTIQSFEKYAFVLASDKNEHQALEVANLYLGNDQNISSMATKFAYVSDISSLFLSNYNINETITLIDSTLNTFDTISNDNQEVRGSEGAFIESLWRVNQVGNDIEATFLGRKTSDKANHLVSAYGETIASMLTISNNALMQGIESARDNVQVASVNAGLSAGSHMKENVFMPFASVYGGYSAVGDDNNIDINSLSFVGGIGYTSYFSNSELLLAAFFETGHGGYNSYDNNIHSEGDANYYGGGLFARFDMYTGAGNAYIEASAKVGSMHYDYYSDDIKNALGVATSYDVDSLYYGAHAGLGNVWNISDAVALDMSAKYFYAHQDGFDENIGGNNFDVDALDSHRIKAGARLTYTMPTSHNFTFTPYAGLYYEHEFNDEVNATIDNFAVPSDNDSNGSTGVLELGVKLASEKGLSANIGVDASLGARESVMSKLEFKYTF